MPPNFLPFLYRTQTLQRACRCPAAFLLVQRAGLATRPNGPKAHANQNDSSIPFEWDNEEFAKDHQPTAEADAKPSTITPSEADIFKGIFDEISEGRLPRPKIRPEFPKPMPERRQKRLIDRTGSGVSGDQSMAGSIVDQARDSKASDQFLQRYPESLQTAAKVALGKFELAPNRPKLNDMIGLDEAEAKQMAEWKRYCEIRNKEKERIDALMKACRSDVELWHVMEKEVFSLPLRLGIVEAVPEQPVKKPKKQPKKPKKSKKKPVEEGPVVIQPEPAPPFSEELDHMIMDVHGPLYPHYLTTGLNLFDSAFSKPSPLAFNILPRVRSLGLPSYVLGVSTPFFYKLAQIHWNRFGDLLSVVEALEEMRSVNLYSDIDIDKLLTEIREQLHACAWGAQGPFVMAVAEIPPYDRSLDGRIEELVNYTRHSLKAQDLKGLHEQDDDMELDLGLDKLEDDGDKEYAY